MISSVSSYRYDEHEEKKIVELSKNFIVYYYSANISTFEADKINRIFNIYMKNIIASGEINSITELLQFINSVNGENDIYNIKSGNNISNLFKYLRNEGLVLNFNNMLNDQLCELINYIVDEKMKVKLNLYYNIIDICYNNFAYLNSNFSHVVKRFGFTSNNLFMFNEEKRIKELNLEVYDKMLKFVYNGMKNNYLWLENEYIMKLFGIIASDKFLYKKLINNINSVIDKYVLVCYNGTDFSIKSLMQKSKIKLRNNLIKFGKSNIKSAINNFTHTYNYYINKFIHNTTDINVLIDGRNIFYCKNEETNHIDLNKIKAYDSKNKYYNSIITEKMVKNNALNKEFPRKNFNYYLIFNENHKDVLNNLNLQNMTLILTPSGLNDDIIQLYLWLSYLGCVLISSDKHSDYINKIKEDRYLHGLFMEYKNKYQFTF